MENQSYFSVLEQYLKSVNLSAIYQLGPEDSNARSRSLNFQLTVNDRTVTGVGKNKKEAKENAAEVMYNSLIADERKRFLNDSEESSQEPVEALIQLCSELSLDTPIFDCESKVISSHSTIHTASCTVCGIREEVKSFKKDRGKNQVAKIMYLKVKDHETFFRDYSRLEEEERRKKNSFRSPDGSLDNTTTEDQLFIKVRSQLLVELLKKSKTAYNLKMKPESDIDAVKDPEDILQRIMKEMEVDFRIYFHFEASKWSCYIEMTPINFKMKMNHKKKSKAGKYAIINTLKYLHKTYVL